MNSRLFLKTRNEGFAALIGARRALSGQVVSFSPSLGRIEKLPETGGGATYFSNRLQMKICVFSTAFSPNVGGIETVLDLLCREFTMLGHEVRVLTTAPGAGVYPFKVVRQPSLSAIVKNVMWCDVLLQANVSLRWAWMLGIAASKSIYQHHTVYELDDGRIPIEEKIKRLLAKIVPGVAVSSFVGRSIGVKFVIHNCYDSEKYVRSGSKTRKHDIAFVGRLVPQKGCEVLVKALAILREMGTNRCLSIIGDGPERSNLESMVQRAGLGGQVRFFGTVTGWKLSELLNQHVAIVVPSTYREPFGMVALEGLACGCRPIVAANGGLLEAAGPFGIPFPNANAEALALAIGSLATQQANPMSQKQVDAHLAQFAPRRVALSYIKRFQTLLG